MEAPPAETRSTATVSQAGEVRLARLESLRGLSAMLILMAHAWIHGQTEAGHGTEITDTFWHRIPFSGGFSLFLFFALSGYLIFWPFANALYGNGGPVALKTYALNRAYRILPLYYAVIAFLLIVQEKGGTFSQWWHFAIFAQNFSLSTVGTVDGPAWTIIVEIHFYILLPFGAYLLGRVAGNRRWLGALIIALVGAVGFALHWRYVSHSPVRPDPRKEYSLPIMIGYFSTGMLVAVLRTAWREGLPSWVRGIFRYSDTWVFLTFPLFIIANNDYRATMLCGFGCAAIVAACVLPLKPGIVMRLLDLRMFSIVGVGSFSIYLLHYPILLHIEDTFQNFPSLFAATLFLSLAGGAITYKLIEEPFLKRRRRWSSSAAQQKAQAATKV